MIPPSQFQQPDLTRLASSSKADVYDDRARTSDPPNYHAAAASSSYHLATGTAHNKPAPHPQFSPSSDNIFRPINQAYIIQASQQQQAAGSYLGSRDRNIGSE